MIHIEENIVLFRIKIGEYSMDTIHFENSIIPVYACTESISDRRCHSEMAHWHDNIEIIVINNGNIKCKTAGMEFDLHAGDVCFINRRQMHEIHAADGEECCHKVLIIGTSLFMQNPAVYDKYIRPMLEDQQFTHVRFTGSNSHAAKISEIVCDISKAQSEKECGYELELIADVLKLGKQLYLAYIEEPMESPADGNAVIQQKMAAFVYDHFSEDITLDDIAASGMVSRSQCSKLFNKYTGMSPISFLNRHRLEVSLEMLRSGAESIAEIAAACGFSDQSYYNRLFLREYGVTPGTYRKNIA